MTLTSSQGWALFWAGLAATLVGVPTAVAGIVAGGQAAWRTFLVLVALLALGWAVNWWMRTRRMRELTVETDRRLAVGDLRGRLEAPRLVTPLGPSAVPPLPVIL